jgi:hypothetical protein
VREGGDGPAPERDHNQRTVIPVGKTTLTEAERAERRTVDRERLEQAARALLTTEGWKRWVTVRSMNGLSRYSFGNQLLIAAQYPEASYVAGFRAFLNLDRCVRKGERAIRIYAPMRLRAQPDTEQTPDTNGASNEEEKRTIFRSVPVFDVSQTDPLPGKTPVALTSPSEPIEGDSHAELLMPLEQLAGELGYTLSKRELDGGPDGWCDYKAKEIVLNSRVSANAQVRIAIHEILHALGIGYTEYGRRRAEVLVDTATYIVCGSIGLDTSGSSVPYVAGWGESGELDAIRTYAETIDTIARRVEDALRQDHSATDELG